MTETSGVAMVQPPYKCRFGTVGVAIPGVEVKISEDKEIMLRGHNMVKSYHKLPEKTEALWTDGWMHTGDLGKVDADGYVSITGRKKDILITAGGKNVAPAEMESYLVALPGIGQAVVVGDRQPYLNALLVLDPETLPVLLDSAGVASSMSADEAAKDETLQAYVQKHVEDGCNAHVARYQQIKYFRLLPDPFSVETDELTPTMKIKRNVVTEKYADVIASMYESAAMQNRT